MKATNDLSRLCVHTQTTKPWDLNACITAYHQAGIQHISIWRHLLENQNLKEVKSELEKHHLQVTSLVRGEQWKNFYEINMVNKDYQAFDASIWDLTPSGILNAPKLIPLENN